MPRAASRQTRWSCACPFSDGETALLASLQNLSAADFTGSQNEEEIAAWALSHPEIESYYTVTLPDGTVLDSGTKSCDMSGMSVEQCEATARKLALLPLLKSVKLGGEGGAQSWESLARLRQILPKTAFKYKFTLYGKECDLSSSSLNFSHIGIADNGDALRRVIPLMPELSYVDMDSCGVSNQEMEKLRAEFPDVKFVWRVWFGEHYSVRTDVQRILASKPSAGGMLYPCGRGGPGLLPRRGVPRHGPQPAADGYLLCQPDAEAGGRDRRHVRLVGRKPPGLLPGA